MGLIQEKLELSRKSIDAIIHRIGNHANEYENGKTRKSLVIKAIISELEALNVEFNQYHAYYYCAQVEKAIEGEEEKK